VSLQLSCNMPLSVGRSFKAAMAALPSNKRFFYPIIVTYEATMCRDDALAPRWILETSLRSGG